MTETTEPLAPPGWYPDPSQVATQRYWDGSAWTDQRAPMAQTMPSSEPLTTRSVLGVVGAILAIVGVFLPQLDSATSLHIAHNSVIANEVMLGALVLLFAIAAGVSAIRTRNEPSRYWGMVVVGVLLAALAIYAGTGKRAELTTTGPLDAGQMLHATPGIGLYAIGAAGLLIAIGGLVRGNVPAKSL